MYIKLSYRYIENKFSFFLSFFQAFKTIITVSTPYDANGFGEDETNNKRMKISNDSADWLVSQIEQITIEEVNFLFSIFRINFYPCFSSLSNRNHMIRFWNINDQLISTCIS